MLEAGPKFCSVQAHAVQCPGGQGHRLAFAC